MWSKLIILSPKVEVSVRFNQQQQQQQHKEATKQNEQVERLRLTLTNLGGLPARRGQNNAMIKLFGNLLLFFHDFQPSNSKRNCYYDCNVTVIAFVAPNLFQSFAVSGFGCVVRLERREKKSNCRG